MSLRQGTSIDQKYATNLITYTFSIFFPQLMITGMGPPGGGRNDITGRFTRHCNIIAIDSFDDATMTRIFTAISDWHFGQGFDGAFLRLGKVSLRNEKIMLGFVLIQPSYDHESHLVKGTMV